MLKRQSIMIRIVLVLTLLILGTLATAVQASGIRDIELTDGSVITGEIVSLSSGVYTIRSESLGTIKIPESRIRVIRARGSAGSSSSGEQVNSLKEKMVGDSEIMGLVDALRSDPDFQEALRDPEIMKAVQAGDISALTANPKFMKLLDKKAVEQIKNKLSR